MDHEEFKKLYAEVEQRLAEKYALVPRERIGFIIGVCSCLLVAAGGGWVAAYKAISSGPAAKITREIEQLKGKAETSALEIAVYEAAFKQSNYFNHMYELALGIDAIYTREILAGRTPATDDILKGVYTNNVLAAKNFFEKQAKTPDKK
jgi:hypothetical protein